jgi:hypothetical protein
MLGAVVAIVSAADMCAAAEAPTGLMVEFLRYPERGVIVDPTPEFSWVVNSAERDDVQTACRIRVVSPADKEGGHPVCVWDSGKVLTADSVNVEYGGEPLEAGASYAWRVMTWDRRGRASEWSEPQRFVMYDRAVPYAPEPGWYRHPPDSLEQTRFTVPRDTDMNAPLFRCTTSRSRLMTTEVKPVTFDKTGEGHYFVDFGRAGFAHLELAISSPAGGAEVTIRLGERADGRAVHTRPGGAIHRSSSTIELKKGTHTYVPRTRGTGRMPLGLSAVPFRYCEIINSPVPLNESMVKQVVHHYAFDEGASRFSSSDEVLDDVWEMCRYTMKATTFCGIYVDGNRQRDPLHGDALINQLGHYCVDREYSMPRYSHEVLVMSRHWSAEWMMCAPLMAWHDYMYTGNDESLRRYYDILKLKTLHDLARGDGLISARIHPSLVEGWLASKEAGRVASIADQTERRSALGALTRGEGIEERRLRSAREKKALAAWARHELGRSAGEYANPGPGDPENVIAWSGSRHIVDIIDWPGGERDGYDIVDVNTVPNAMHHGTLVAMRRIARALGKHDDVRFFAERAALVRRSVNAKLFDPRRGVYVDGEGSEHASLHANMFPLAFGLVPEERKGRVLDFVRGKGMACSVYGAQYLLEGLYISRDAAAEQHALDLMRARTQRSWAHMIYDVGSTVAMEAWDIRNKGNLDWNHAWGAAPANIIPRFLMGIRPLEPGFGRVLVEPMPGDLRHAECTMPTIRGPVRVSFEQAPGKSFTLEVTIPANMTARVSVPSLGGDSPAVTLDGARVVGRRDGDRVTVDGIGSGRHVLERRAP